MLLELKAVAPIEGTIDFAHVKQRMLQFAQTIKKLEPEAQISHGSVIIVQAGRVSQYDPCGVELCSESLSRDCIVNEWFADIQVDCSLCLAERLRKHPWDDNRMVVFIPAPISASVKLEV